MIVFMSLVGNTRKFVNKVNEPAVELSIDNSLDLELNTPFILIVPTYSEEISDIVREFLENETNRDLCKGIVGAGNRNFAQLFCYTAKDLSKEFDLPLLHLFEFQGSSLDVKKIEEELEAIV